MFTYFLSTIFTEYRKITSPIVFFFFFFFFFLQNLMLALHIWMRKGRWVEREGAGKLLGRPHYWTDCCFCKCYGVGGLFVFISFIFCLVYPVFLSFISILWETAMRNWNPYFLKPPFSLTANCSQMLLINNLSLMCSAFKLQSLNKKNTMAVLLSCSHHKQDCPALK